jgi:outer membrane receptor protein involved in Fe transport
LSAYLGFRLETVSVRTSGRDISAQQSQFKVWSPNVQVLGKLSAGHQFRAAISRTYRAPSTRDIVPRRWVTNDNTPTTPDFQGNPNLRPELSWGLDVAYEFVGSGPSQVSFAVASRRVRDVVLYEVGLIGQSYVMRPGNFGSATIYSIEADTKLSLKKIDSTFPDIDLRGNVSQNWSRVHNVPGPKNRLSQQIPVSATIGADYRSADSEIATGVTLSFQGGGYSRLSRERSVLTSDSFAVDLYLRKKIHPDGLVSFSVNNALAQRTTGVSNYNFADGSRQENHSVTPTYRTLRLAYEYRF